MAQRFFAFAFLQLFVLSADAFAYPLDHEVVLQSFAGLNGIMPQGGVVFDSLGNLFGTTFTGGRADQGEMFELLRPQPSSSHWKLKILHTFNHTYGSLEGQSPAAALTFDSAGNLFGTTEYGGVNGSGTVFMLPSTPSGGMAGSVTTLYSFSEYGGVAPHYLPVTGVTLDAAGNIYGTTQGAGHSSGIVYMLSPTADGSTPWPITILHDFAFVTGDGAYTSSSVIFDARGNLFGETFGGGRYNYGTVFELSPPTGGATAWTETILSDIIQSPAGGLVFDKLGNLYGTDKNAAFKLSPPASGTGAWKYVAIHTFSGGVDGADAHSGMTFDAQGNLYGVTAAGGATNNGIAFELSLSGARWKETIVTDFASPLATGGRQPTGSLQIDAAGTVYGTTSIGGRSSCSDTTGAIIGCGTVYQLTH